MRKLLMVGAVLAALVTPSASQAQFTLGLRTGYGIASGDVGGSGANALAMSDWVGGQIPFQVDAMWRFTPEISAGLYGSLGVGLLSSDITDTCDAIGATCSALVTRIGIQGIYTFTMVSPKFVPWAGLGFGYEWNSASLDTDDISFEGWEYFNLQAGLDWQVNKLFGFGPFLQYAYGQYDSGTVNGQSADITDTAAHSWFTIGVRGKFDFGAK